MQVKFLKLFSRKLARLALKIFLFPLSGYLAKSASLQIPEEGFTYHVSLPAEKVFDQADNLTD